MYNLNSRLILIKATKIIQRLVKDFLFFLFDKHEWQSKHKIPAAV